MLVDAFSGNVRGMGPGVAEFELEERSSEPIIVFASDKEISDYMRRHGSFEPHLLSPEELEYTTLPDVVKKMKDRFEPIPQRKK